MRRFKPVLISILIGLLFGLWFGINIGKGKPILSNPFAKRSITRTLKHSGEKILEKSGQALEETGKSLKDSVTKDSARKD